MWKRGILNFILVAEHEFAHQRQYHDGVLSAVTYNHPTGGDPNDPNGDFDGDGLSNGYELAHHLDPRDPNTAKTPEEDHETDSDVLAEIQGLNVMLDLKDAWMQDWADAGLQFGAWGPHNDLTYSLFGFTAVQPTYHPWAYVDGATGLMFEDPVAPFLRTIP